MVAWLGDALVDVEDGRLVARHDDGRGPARELARDVRDFRASHDERFVVYEDVGGALHAVSIDGRRRVDFAHRIGTARVDLSRIVTAGPPGSAVAIVLPSLGDCDHCDVYGHESAGLTLGGCGRLDVVPLDGEARPSGLGQAILLDVHRPTARMLVDAWRPDGTHGVQLVDASALDRPEHLLDLSASVSTVAGGSRKVECEGAIGKFSPSGSKVALTLYSGVTVSGHRASTGLRFGDDRLFDAAAKPREVRAVSDVGFIVEAADDGLLVWRETPSGLQFAAEGWGEASSRVVAELAGEWHFLPAPLGDGAWLAQPLDHARAPVVVTRAGSRTLEAPSELGQVFDHRFSMVERPEAGSLAGPTHLYDTRTLRRTASIPTDLKLEALAANGKVLVVSPRGTRRLILRAH